MNDLGSLMRRLQQKKGILFTWYLSCFVAVFALLCIFGAIYINYDAKLRKKTLEFNEYVFDRVADSINRNLYYNNLIQLNFMSGDKLSDVFALKNADEYYSSASVYEIVEEIRLYNESFKNIDLIYIYMPETDRILSTNGVLPSLDFYNMYYSDEIIEYSQWIDKMKNTASNEYNLTYYGNSTVTKVIENTFAITGSSAKATCVIVSDAEKFMGDVARLDMFTMCDIYVYSEYGRLLISDISSGIADEDLPKDIRDLTRFGKDGKNIVYTSPVENSDWVVASVIPQSVVVQENKMFRLYAACLLTLSLIALVLIINVMLKRSYKPIQKLFSILKLNDGIHKYDDLFEELNKLQEDNKNMKKKVDAQGNELSEFMLLRLMQGDLYSLSRDENFYSFKWNCFAVIIFYLKSIDELFQGEEMNGVKRKYYLRIIIENIFTELYNEKGADVYFAEANGNIVGLINMPEDNMVSADEFCKSIDYGIEFINQNYDISLIYTLSERHKDVSGIPRAYEEAMQALRTVIIYDLNEPMKYDAESCEDYIGYVFSIKQQQNLIEFLRTGNREQATNTINGIFASISENKIRSDYLSVILYDVVNTIIKCAVTLKQKGYNIHINRGLYKIIQPNAPIELVYQDIMAYVADINASVNEYEQSEGRIRGKEKRFNEIVAFVDENYTNPELNVSYVANAFGLGASYVSKVFKEGMKMSLTDYLNVKRITTAKNLMETTADSLEIIAEKSGFNHVRTFYRVYKKYKGDNK